MLGAGSVPLSVRAGVFAAFFRKTGDFFHSCVSVGFQDALAACCGCFGRLSVVSMCVFFFVFYFGAQPVVEVAFSICEAVVIISSVGYALQAELVEPLQQGFFGHVVQRLEVVEPYVGMLQSLYLFIERKRIRRWWRRRRAAARNIFIYIYVSRCIIIIIIIIIYTK